MRSGGNVANMGILGAKTSVGNGASSLHIATLYTFHEIIGMIQMVVVGRLYQFRLQFTSFWDYLPTLSIGNKGAVGSLEL